MLTLAFDPLQWLQSRLVSDVMTQGVTVIPDSAVMDDAADLLATQGASGAPVVDRRGHCIGVLSTADFMRVNEEEQSRSADRDNSGSAELPWNSVQRYMSSPVHTIWPDAPFFQAAKLMCATGIHRLVVVNDRDVSVGLVSTLDLIAAFVHAVEKDG